MTGTVVPGIERGFTKPKLADPGRLLPSRPDRRREEIHFGLQLIPCVEIPLAFRADGWRRTASVPRLTVSG